MIFSRIEVTFFFALILLSCVGQKEDAPVAPKEIEKEEKEKEPGECKPFFKSVLVADFTAAWCVYCPDMKEIIQQVKETRPGRLVEMSIHYADGMECAEGDSLTNLFKMELWPTVVFDMNYEQKTSSLSTAVLSAMVDTALSNACSVCGIKAYSKLDGSSLSANICITSPEDGDFVLQVAITEDEIIAQQAGRGGGYHHNNVLRTIPVTVKLGLKKNREESFLFDYFISENRSPENTYIIVSVMATGDGRNIMNNAIKFAAGSDVEYVFED